MPYYKSNALLKIDDLVYAELYVATQRYGTFNSYHEGYAVIREEVDELWDEIKGVQDIDEMKKEAIQIAAMAIRFIMDLCEIEKK